MADYLKITLETPEPLSELKFDERASPFTTYPSSGNLIPAPFGESQNKAIVLPGDMPLYSDSETLGGVVVPLDWTGGDSATTDLTFGISNLTLVTVEQSDVNPKNILIKKNAENTTNEDVIVTPST